MSTTVRRSIVSLLCFGFAVAGIIIGYWLRGFMAVDGCLDAGGRWNYQSGYCERLITEEEAYPLIHGVGRFEMVLMIGFHSHPDQERHL